MHMDGAALFAAAQEMRTLLDGGRIERIAQPARFELILVIRANGKNRRLLLSADPEAARAYLCDETKKGPDKPFPFLMLIRKHILHGRITAIETPKMDRALTLRINASNELGDRVEYALVCEIMGKHSNIILVDGEGNVLDSVKRVTPSMSSLRTVLPGDAYMPPPSQDKTDLLEATPEQIRQALRQTETGSADKAVVNAFYGVSPFTARQICRAAQVEEDSRLPLRDASLGALADACRQFSDKLKHNEMAPCLLKQEVEWDGFFPLAPIGYESKAVSSMNDALQEYYDARARQLQIGRLRTSITDSITDKLGKLYKRLALQEEKRVNPEEMERVRIEGELILTYTHMIKRGMESVELYNHYEDKNVIVKLDSSLNASANAAKRFRRYNRMKSAAEAGEQQKAEIKPEIDYLESVLLSVEQTDDYDSLLEIRDELHRENRIARPQQRSKHAPPRESQPIHFAARNGTEILAGRNNAQNDLVTMRLARSTDTWLHAQGMPGSHVVIRGSNVTSETLLDAANIAAYFSRGRRSSNVPIDYTLIKNVRKPSGAKPGYVTYVAQKTLFITPDEKLVKSMIREEL